MSGLKFKIIIFLTLLLLPFGISLLHYFKAKKQQLYIANVMKLNKISYDNGFLDPFRLVFGYPKEKTLVIYPTLPKIDKAGFVYE
jgi:hypothetical protein